MTPLVVATIALILGPMVVHAIGRDGRTTALVVAASLGVIGIAGCLLPWFGTRVLWLVGLSVIVGVALLIGERGRFGVAIPKRFLRLTVALLPPLILIGGLEWIAWLTTESGWLALPTPIRTMYLGPNGKPVELADWRVYHMNKDDTKEPDPVLLWKPVATEPFNAQRFQGPIVEVPKPPKVFRILVYGDSNTAMPGAWPLALRKLLQQQTPDRYEVVNAGVEGYTSYQGLMRYRQERSTYQPDLVLVSFGWNDPSPAVEKPDKDYLPSLFAARALHVAMRYRSYRLLVAWLRPKPAAHPRIVGSRVGREDYAANLRAFVEEGRRTGVTVVLMTRPHRVKPIEGDERWLEDVRPYNQIVREVAKATGTQLIDSEAWFGDEPGLFLPNDSCHLTRIGHMILGGRVCEQLFPALCPPGSADSASEAVHPKLDFEHPPARPPGETIRATATGCDECERHQLYVGPNAIDGKPATEWLAPTSREATLEIRLDPPTAIKALGVLNAQNLPYRDRGTLVLHVEVLRSDQVVFETYTRFRHKNDEPEWLGIGVDVESADRIRLTVVNWFGLGGGLAEVRLF